MARPPIWRSPNTPLSSQTPRLRKHVWQRIAAVLVTVSLLAGPGSPFAVLAGIDLTAAHAAPLTASSGGTPNRFNPHTGATSTIHLPPRPTLHVTRSTGLPAPIPRPSGATIPPALLPLHPYTATSFLGQDGRFEIDVPAGAITAADQANAPGSALQLSIRQIAGASGSSAGGSGLVSFGTYLIQVVDGNGVLANQGLRKPLTFKMHLSKAAGAFDLARAFVVLNGSLPVNVTGAPTSLVVPDIRSGTIAPPDLGKYSSQPATYDPKQQVLVTTNTVSTPSTSLSWNTDSPVSFFGNPDPFNADLSGGALTTSIPLDVPSGPGGLTPPIALTYDSAGVSEQHDIQGAAGWVGEGWNLSLGSVSWAEHNSNATCTSGCGNGWEDTWQLSDPFGTAIQLIPPNINVSTYFDDTPNSITASPVRWQSTPANYAKVYSYTGPLTLPDANGVHPPCFRAFLTNGIMEEFGCTADSLEYYYTPGMGDYISSWNLDLITDPQGNQIHITYQQDVAGTTNQYIRDAVPATIEWDSPNCHNAQQMCTGSSWEPLMHVQFNAAYALDSTRILNTPANCDTGWHLRCDDPLDLSGSGGTVAPLVVHTLALQDALVQVRTSATGTWNTLKDYQFYYNLNGPSTTTDASTGKAISAAGYLLLGRLTVEGTSGYMPSSNFTYIAVPQYYEDSNFYPNPSTYCGPPWNTGTGSGCFLWSQNQPGNEYFLDTFDNGMGLQEVFYWQLARNNTHGVPSGGDPSNPFWCNGYQTSSPCQEADDQNWSRVVLTKTESTVQRSASTGNVGVTSRVIYSYVLTYPLVAQECSDCVAGMYWGNQNDGDYLDYYNGAFMGFAEANVSNPDGSVVMHKYDATEGYGLYDSSVPCLAYTQPCRVAPWWHVMNAAHGHEIETDYYDTNGTTLLKKVTNQYQAVCPPSGVSGTPAWSTTLNSSPYTYTWDGMLVAELDHGNPVVVCDVQTTRTDEYIYDGTTQNIDKTTTYSYDSYGRQTQMTENSSDAGSTNGNGGSTGNPTAITTHTDYIWNDAVTASSTSATGTYLIDVSADTIIEDPGNTTHYSCTFTGYDGQASATGQQSGLTLGEVTTQDQYTSCGTSSNAFATSGLIRTTYTYDTYGNRITTDDPDANAGNITHLGCTIGSTLYTNCTTYDTTFDALPIISTNALNQATTTGYTTSAGGGFGLWPTSTTDANGQVTTYAYDGLGRMTSQTLPDETNAPTISWAYTVWCNATGAQTPCVEVDQTQRIDSSTTVTTRAFYDGYGHLVETRAPAPGGYDVVTYANYDPSERLIFKSNPYFVPAYTGGPGASAFATPDVTQDGTTTTYDGLDRVVSVKDPLSHITTTSYSQECGEANDWGCYEQTTTVDANHHQQATLTDALGRELYDLRYTGNSASTYAVYAITQFVYDSNGNLVKITQPNGTSVTTYTYDAAGRKVGMTDPDRGTESYTYDADGNLIQSTDGRGSAGTAYAGYDGLDRQLWRSTTNNPTHAYVTYTYDANGNGSAGIGHLTAESFTGGPNNTLSGSYSYVYDARGRTTRIDQTMGGVGACPSGWTCQDIGNPTLAGTQSYTGNGFWTVSGTGSDIWGTSDQFHFVSQALTGDGSISARISSQTNSSQFAKAGVMLRDGTAADAPFYYLQVEPNGQYYVTDRITTGGSAAIIASGSVTLPVYLKVTRSGTTFSASTSVDGVTWTAVAGSSVTLNTSSTLQAGVAVTSVNTGALSTATVDNITPNASPPTSVTTSLVGAPAGVTSFSTQQTYDDANNELTQTYPDGEVLSTAYMSSGWFAGLTQQQGTTSTTLVNSVSYSGNSGAAGLITSMSLGNGAYTQDNTYDLLGRQTDARLTRTSDSALLFDETRILDPTGNVTSTAATLPQGTDTQQFCYDEQNRLTWAGSTGTPPCTGTAITPGTLTSAEYTQSFSYDNMGRLTSGPLGSYTYGDSAHVHAATSIGTGYTASYDAAGNMTCRAPTSATTCSGSSPTGAQLSWNAQGDLTAWQNAPSNPSNTIAYLYDGEGNRVAQQSTQSGSTTTTVYVGKIEEIATSGSNTTTTTYYYADSQRIAMAVNGTLSYLGTDSLGSATVALDTSGNVQAAILYAPYGTTRFSFGTMPGSYGFTGQHTDAATGLDYYVARYYDPVAGQFVSADPAGDGLDLFAYVKGNPETLTDPNGLMTGGACGGYSLGALVGVFAQTCVVVGWSQDDGWSVGLTSTHGAGAYAGWGGGVSIGPQFSNAHSVEDLSGPFGYAGGGAGPVDGSGFIGKDSKGRTVVGVDVQFTVLGDSTPHAVGGLSDTKVQEIDVGTKVNQAKDWVHHQIKDWLRHQIGKHLSTSATPSGSRRLAFVARRARVQSSRLWRANMVQPIIQHQASSAGAWHGTTALMRIW